MESSPSKALFHHSRKAVYFRPNTKKGGPKQAAILKNITSRGLLHTLLRQTCALGRTLTSFELGIRLADHVGRAFAGDHLAIGVAALGGGE